MKTSMWVVICLAGWISARAAETVAYSYDDAGRLTNAAYSGGANIAYAYDANGNLLMRTVTAAGGTTYTLIYRAGTGGWIDGVATQVVAEGQSGTPVTAASPDRPTLHSPCRTAPDTSPPATSWTLTARPATSP